MRLFGILLGGGLALALLLPLTPHPSPLLVFPAARAGVSSSTRALKRFTGDRWIAIIWGGL